MYVKLKYVRDLKSSPFTSTLGISGKRSWQKTISNRYAASSGSGPYLLTPMVPGSMPRSIIAHMKLTNGMSSNRHHQPDLSRTWHRFMCNMIPASQMRMPTMNGINPSRPNKMALISHMATRTPIPIHHCCLLMRPSADVKRKVISTLPMIDLPKFTV